MKFVALLVLLATAIAIVSCQSIPTSDRPDGVTFTWLGGDGIWEDPTKWSPLGQFPRSGNHQAVISAPGNYTIRQTRFILAGSIVVTAPGALLVLNPQLGWFIDANTYAPPTIDLVSDTLPGRFNISLLDVLGPEVGPVDVTIRNLNNKGSITVSLPAFPIAGAWFLSLPIRCTNGVWTNDYVEAQAFDAIEVSYTARGVTAVTRYTIIWTDRYQSRLGWDTVAKNLFVRALQKNLVGLTNLRHKLLFVDRYLPAYADNHCCPDESYIYPLSITTLAVESSRFLSGTPSAAFKTCYTTLIQFCARTTEQLENEIGPVPIQWTGLGLSNQWGDRENWFPNRVPNFRNAVAYVDTVRQEVIYLNEDTTVRQAFLGENVQVLPFDWQWNVGTPSTVQRAFWYQHGNYSWQNPARWEGKALPTPSQAAVLGGFGNVILNGNVAVTALLNTGANQNAESQGVLSNGFTLSRP